MSKIDDEALKLINQDRKKYSYESLANKKKNENSPLLSIFLLAIVGFAIFSVIQTIFFDKESEPRLTEEEILKAATDYLKEETAYTEAICDKSEEQTCTDDNCGLRKYQVTCHTEDVEFEMTAILTIQSKGINQFNFSVLTDTIHSYTP